MYYRRKILLSVLETFGGEMNNTDFQKLLFLFTKKQAKPNYEFVPYKYGCFSFQSYADKRTLIKYGYLKDQDNWKLTDKADKISYTLNKQDLFALKDFTEEKKDLKGKELIKFVYTNYPYYAIHSEISGELLNNDELKLIDQQKPKGKNKILYTIGYEGITLEAYLNKLIQDNIKLLCDVRKNPLSMKYGFSKRQLQDACERLGIAYVHVPELGIISEKRQNLNTQKDYDLLFEEYEKTTLIKQKTALKTIQNLMREHHRIALTCFEADQCQCHRGRVVKALKKLSGWDYPITHL